MSGWFYKVTYPCDKVRDFMYDYLDDSLPTFTSIRFHMHLNGCAECREYLFLYKKAANAKEFRKEHPAPDALLASTLDFLKQEGIADAGADADSDDHSDDHSDNHSGDWEPGKTTPGS